jgi:hypothetical protein
VIATGQLFDAEEGARLRDEGMARADRAADPQWKEAVVNIVRGFSSGRLFTADDIWDLLVLRFPDLDTEEHRALGPLLQWRVRKVGLAEPTDQIRPSRRSSRHTGTVRVWRRL